MQDPPTPISYDDLRATVEKERQQSDLQQLDESFYVDVGVLLNDLYEERNGLVIDTDDPHNNPDVTHLSDKIETVERSVEQLYQRRVGKILKQVGFVAMGMSEKPDGLTSHEENMFASLVRTIQQNKSDVNATVGLDRYD